MQKYFYCEEFCPTSHYRGLYPLSYNKNDEGIYQKSHMYCDLVERGECHLDKECPVFLAAPDTIDHEQEWRLYSKKLGTQIEK